MPDDLLEARNLVKYYGAKKALDGLSLNLRAGEIHILLGRNGSGKTTLAKILAGILRQDSGVLCAEGIDGATCGPGFRRNVGFLFDSSAHWTNLTGMENAWFYARSLGLSEVQSSERIGVLFDQLSLTAVANDQVGTYSFGMKRKLALVQALVHEPKILILDEPSIGLDYASRITIYTLLRAHATRGLAVLIATNDMNEARYLADKVSLIDKGKVLAAGSPADLINALDREVTVEFDLKIPVNAEVVSRIPGVLGATVSEDRTPSLQVLTAPENEQRVIMRLLEFLSNNNAGFSKLNIRRPDLGDVFLKYAEVATDEAR